MELCKRTRVGHLEQGNLNRELKRKQTKKKKEKRNFKNLAGVSITFWKNSRFVVTCEQLAACFYTAPFYSRF